ncbi:hypothetical protein HF086_003654 [Spodoptera exigua]|uniref:Ig-like domain-containing protein n=1 Tax=Spodoptera exigua TaxID=7107 RepID=A0A922S8X3_SPOEX|nr:hypothetical protein HF086_003654 [Spodoptera exigua]
MTHPHVHTLVRPDEELPEPTLRIMARSTVYNVGETKAIFCKGQNLVEPIQWYSPSGKLVEERSTKNSRVFVERKTEDNGVLVPLIIHRIKISDGGNWTCKAGNLTETKEFIVGGSKNVTCSAIANPPPTYRWFRRINGYDDDAITDPDTVITSEDGTNSVLVLRIRDESYYGEYRCSANNSKGSESIIFHVNPGSKPLPPDTVQLAAANTTNLTFNVTCSSCNFATPDEVPESPDPKNLTVIGYIFQLAPSKPGYPADWDGAPEFRVDIESANNTLFTLGPLSNSTVFHVRVRTRNAAGNSEWLEAGDAATTDDAIRLSATLLLMIAAICMHLY